MRDIRRTMQLQLEKIRYKITIQAQQYDKQACAVGEKGQRKKINKTQTWTRNLTIYRKDSWYTPYIKFGGNEDDAVSLKSFSFHKTLNY